MIDPQIFDNRPLTKNKKLNCLPQNPESIMGEKAVKPGRFPSWLHRKIPAGNTLKETESLLSEKRLHTVCEEAKCPNLPECWSKKTATFLVMGKECTRACGFCSIDFSKKPKILDFNEPKRVAESVKSLSLKHVVITMVARDDLEDGGAFHLTEVIKEIKLLEQKTTIEVLTSDFEGKEKAIDIVLNAKPDIFNYNIETVRSLTPKVRHKATYERTLWFLNYIRKKRLNENMQVKSGLMVGLGESVKEVEETILDLKIAGCDIITIGQYLQSDRHKLLVKEFITPIQFKAYEEFAKNIGVKKIYSAPFVRSSYNAEIFV